MARTVGLELDSAKKGSIRQQERQMNCVARVWGNERFRKSRSAHRSGAAVILSLLFFTATAVQVQAGDIVAFRDADGRCVYVNSNDRELSSLVKKKGVAAVPRQTKQLVLEMELQSQENEIDNFDMAGKAMLDKYNIGLFK